MRKQLLLIASAVVLGLTACTSDIIERLDKHEQDIALLKGDVMNLQASVKKINSNIEALQTALDALNSNAYVKDVTDVKDASGNVVGYTISFTNNKTITIYHGEKGGKGDKGDKGDPGDPGAPGTPGTPGNDGATPVIGVAEYDGILYWTVNGEFLRDEPGHLVPVTGAPVDKGD